LKRLKVALMGLSGVGADYLTAIRSDDRFDLVAVADTDSEILRRQAEVLPYRPYEDYRSLIVETAHSGLDLLFVALAPFQSIEFVELAAARGIGVFHKAPCARTVDEAGRLVRWFANGRCPLVVSREWQFEPACAVLDPLPEIAGYVYAAIAHVRTADAPVRWRGDSVRAGGGVLLNGAYEAVDMLIHLLGLPETVHARCGLAIAPPAPRKYDTEDVAVVSLDFGSGRIAGVTTMRGATKPSWSVTFLGVESTVEVRADGMTITPRDGGPVEHYAVQSTNPAAHAISAFGASRLSGAERFESTAREHIATMAAIEAAYLSARTGAPEAPARFTD